MTCVIDPDSALEGFGVLLDLDEHGIYGSRIWMLYKDVCFESVPSMVAVLRAYQLGQLAGCTDEAIDDAIDGKGDLDMDAIMGAVQKELPKFNKPS